MKKIAYLASCAVLLLSLCGGCESGSAGPEVIEPAMLISTADAKMLTGGNFNDCVVTEQPVVGMKLCVYDNGQDFLQIGLTQTASMPEDNKRNPKEIYAGIKEAFPDAEKMEGVGDDNFIAPPGLHILQGEYYISISLGLTAKDREKLKVVALKAIDNLEKLARP